MITPAAVGIATPICHTAVGAICPIQWITRNPIGARLSTNAMPVATGWPALTGVMTIGTGRRNAILARTQHIVRGIRIECEGYIGKRKNNCRDERQTDAEHYLLLGLTRIPALYHPNTIPSLEFAAMFAARKPTQFARVRMRRCHSIRTIVTASIPRNIGRPCRIDADRRLPVVED